MIISTHGRSRSPSQTSLPIRHIICIRIIFRLLLELLLHWVSTIDIEHLLLILIWSLIWNITKSINIFVSLSGLTPIICQKMAIIWRGLFLLRHYRTECNLDLGVRLAAQNIALIISIIYWSLVKTSIIIIGTCVSSRSKFVLTISGINSYRKSGICSLNMRARNICCRRNRSSTTPNGLLTGLIATRRIHLMILRGVIIGLIKVVQTILFLRNRVRIILIWLNHIATHWRVLGMLDGISLCHRIRSNLIVNATSHLLIILLLLRILANEPQNLIVQIGNTAQ